MITFCISCFNRVTIVGGPESQWKAQYLIFEKLREEVLQNISVLTKPQLQTSIIHLCMKNADSKMLARVSALGLRMFGSQLKFSSHRLRSKFHLFVFALALCSVFHPC